MSQTEIIIYLTSALALGAWAFLTELRIRKLQGQLVLSQEKIKDEEIVKAVHELSDDDMRAKMSDYFGVKPQS